MSDGFQYKDPRSVKLPLNDKLSNFFKRAVAKIKGETQVEQVGLRPDGEIGTYILDCGGQHSVQP
ncbi:MAG: hypothetical protein CL565_02095 [Alphaproteobacteria bacterium]|nr:hypothetical protein [Alphaproteobacteria bacterium]